MEEKIRTEKKLWSKPELIVLVRSDPEEAVLVGCKRLGTIKGSGNQTDCKTKGQPCANSATASS